MAINAIWILWMVYWEFPELGWYLYWFGGVDLIWIVCLEGLGWVYVLGCGLNGFFMLYMVIDCLLWFICLVWRFSCYMFLVLRLYALVCWYTLLCWFLFDDYFVSLL